MIIKGKSESDLIPFVDHIATALGDQSWVIKEAAVAEKWKIVFFDKSGISIIPIISLPNFKVSCLFGTIITHIIIVS